MAVYKKGDLCRTTATNAFDLLSEVADLIEAQPMLYNQNHWKADLDHVPNWEKKHLDETCGTVCCVAGWVDELTTPTPVKAGSNADTRYVAHNAMTILGLHELASEEDNEDSYLPMHQYELFRADAVLREAKRQGIETPDPGTPAYARLGASHVRRFRDRYADKLKEKKL